MAVQTGHDTVEVSWTAPRVPPAGGYRIIRSGSNTVSQASVSPVILTITTPGVYSVRLMSLSQHFPIGDLETRFTMHRKH